MSENVNHKLVVCGDVHLQSSEPKRSNAIDTLNWIFNNEELNCETNDLIMLGDIAEINSPFNIYSVYVDLFTNKSRFNKIRIIQGNHDCVSIDSILDLFAPLKNVEIITDWKVIDFYNTKILALPFYNHEGVASKKSMVETYSHLYENEEIKDVEFDYCCGHLEDETNHFSKKYCDLSQLKVKHFLHGHIHSCNLHKGGRYLGSACMNSSSEQGNTKYLAIIDGETKEYELKEIPKFMEYYSVEYPNPLPKINTKYGIFLVTNSIDKNTTIEEYSKQAETMGFKFYARRIMSKKSTVDIEECTDNSNTLTFDDFAKASKLEDDIADICKEVIRLKSEE